MKSIAFVGLGNMGLPMLSNLVKAGYRVHAADVRREAVAAAVAQGAVAAESVAAATGQAEVVVTMVPNSPEVEVAYLGPGGVLEGARPGQIAIDMSTIDPATTRKVGARLEAAGVRMLDAPVSGGVPGAVAGTLTIMVGGDPAVVAQARPILGGDGQERRPRGAARVRRGGQDLQQPARRRLHDRGRRGVHDRDPGRGRSEDPPRRDPDQLGQLLGHRAQLPGSGTRARSRRRIGSSRPGS